MRNFFPLLVSGCLILGSALSAQPAQHLAQIEALRAKGGGFYNPSGSKLYRIDELDVLPDGAVVRLSGSIQDRVQGDRYLFVEGRSGMPVHHMPNRMEPRQRGQLILEIGSDRWRGQVFTPHDSVIIMGEVERHAGRLVVKVRSIASAHESMGREEAPQFLVPEAMMHNQVHQEINDEMPAELRELRQRRLEVERERSGQQQFERR